MPELPEVETVRRGLEPVLVGRTIRHADVRRPDLRWPFPENMKARLEGRRVLALRRRSKYLLADLDSGETLLVHLGMSGRLIVHGYGHEGQRGSTVEKSRHDHVRLEMDDQRDVVFNDPRRFGMMDLCRTETLHEHRLLCNLGPEPLGNRFGAEYLTQAMKSRRSPMKLALLDQKLVAGLGNIYVCESLWRAGISPRRRSDRLSSKRAGTLAWAIRETLLEAIDSGGSTLRDYRRADGELGGFQDRFAVYDRRGMHCKTVDCTGKVARITQSGRSTYYCPRCQR